MKRERPPMPPLSVRIDVVHRQLQKMGKATVVFDSETKKDQLKGLLRFVAYSLGCEAPDLRLDHDPALILREYDATVSDVAARYTPHAHDPNHLVYREKADHDRKTFGRTPGAERTVTTKGSDIWLKSKFDRLEGRTKQRPKQKIPQRKNPWQRNAKARF